MEKVLSSAAGASRTIIASCAPSRKRAVCMVFWNASSSRYYEVARSRHGLTGLNLLQILESRLDNVVYRLGYADSRAQARLLVTHGHFSVNGRRTDVPSMLVSQGDVVSVREGSFAARSSKTWLLWLRIRMFRPG